MRFGIQSILVFLMISSVCFANNGAGKISPQLELQNSLDQENEALDEAALKQIQESVCQEALLNRDENSIVITSLNSKDLKKQKLSRDQRNLLLEMEQSGEFANWHNVQALKQRKIMGKFITKIEDGINPIHFLCNGFEYIIATEKYLPQIGGFRTNQPLKEVVVIKPKSLKEVLVEAKNKFVQKWKRNTVITAMGLAALTGAGFYAEQKIEQYMRLDSMTAQEKILEQSLEEAIKHADYIYKYSENSADANQYLYTFALNNISVLRFDQLQILEKNLKGSKSEYDSSYSLYSIKSVENLTDNLKNVKMLRDALYAQYYIEHALDFEKLNLESILSQMNAADLKSLIIQLDDFLRTSLKESKQFSDASTFIDLKSRYLNLGKESVSLKEDLFLKIMSNHVDAADLAEILPVNQLKDISHHKLNPQFAEKLNKIIAERTSNQTGYQAPVFSEYNIQKFGLYVAEKDIQLEISDIRNYEAKENHPHIGHAISVAMGSKDSNTAGMVLTWYFNTHVNQLKFEEVIKIATKASTPTDITKNSKADTYRYRILTYYRAHYYQTLTQAQKKIIDDLISKI